MNKSPNSFLIIGAVLSFLAALLHVGCIVFGAPWFRFFGAGERMAQMALRGHWYPTAITLFITAILLIWAGYALSGAGVLPRFPLLRLGLCVITGIYMVRALVGFPLIFFPGENGASFWFWSSTICLIYGIVHLIGLRQVWPRL